MKLSARPFLALSLAVALVVSGCGDEGADDGASAGEVDVPAEWQEHTFSGGAFATPADWSETDPMGEDEMTIFGPDVDDGLPFAVRVRTTERDEVPFEELPGLFGGTLVLQLQGVEAVGEDPIEVPGAEEAVVATFRYEEPVDGEVITVEERVLIAWFGGDRQLQLRLGVSADVPAAEAATIDEVLGTVVLDGG